MPFYYFNQCQQHGLQHELVAQYQAAFQQPTVFIQTSPYFKPARSRNKVLKAIAYGEYVSPKEIKSILDDARKKVMSP